MTKFEDIFDFQGKYKYLAHIKDERKETLQEHTDLANIYFEKIVEHEGDRQIGKQAGGDNAKVTEIPAHEVYEKE